MVQRNKGNVTMSITLSKAFAKHGTADKHGSALTPENAILTDFTSDRLATT